MEHVEIVWEGKGRAAKAYAPGLGCRDTLRLPLADVVALVFRHEGEHLEHNVAEKGAHQILASPGVQKGHVQYGDVHALFLGEHPREIINRIRRRAMNSSYVKDFENPDQNAADR